jgi:hypothetical protein
MSMRLRLYCPDCETDYETPIALLVDMPVAFCGNLTFHCPKGHTSTIPSSTIEIRDGILHIRNAAGSGPLLEQMKQHAKNALQGKVGPGDTAKRITEAPFNPSTALGGTIGTKNWSDPTAWTSRVPLPQDDVMIKATPAKTVLTADMPRLGRNIHIILANITLQ